MIRRNQQLRGLDQEILDHIEQATLEYIDHGLSPGDARRAALREFGNITLAKEGARAVWIPVWLDQTIQDARYGIRLLLRYPGFTAVVVLTLAMSIGANAAIFTLVNQTLLHPPGISHPERLISVRVDTKTYKAVNVSAPAFADVRESRQVFEHTAAQDLVNLNYVNGGDPLKLTGAAVSAEWFDVFGAKPREGRVFAPEEDQPGAPHVVVLAYTTWVQLFGADPKVIGRKIELSQQTYKIIGVMESSFQQPRGAAVWVPLALPPEAFAPKERGGGVLQVVARMRPTMHFAQASSWLKVLTERATNEGTADSLVLKNSNWSLSGILFTDQMSGGIKIPLLVLLVGVGLVLLIACLNIGGLMLARTSARAHEIAMRAALGASRFRLIRQILSESLLLATAGAVLGLVLAQGGTTLLLKIAPEGITKGIDASPDVYVLLFTATAGIFSGIVCAIGPALQLSKTESLKAGARTSTAGPGRQRLGSALVILETGLAVVLLVAAGLLLRTVAALERVNPGFDSHGVMTAMFSLPPSRYPNGIKQSEFYRTVLDRLGHTVGVTACGIGVGIPFSNWVWGDGFEIEGHQRVLGEPLYEGTREWVTPGYFTTLKIPLKWGRYLSDQDRLGEETAVVIDEKLASQFWPTENPPRSRISLGGGQALVPVVGVVGHVKSMDLTDENTISGMGMLYFNLFQRKEQFSFSPVGWIVARTNGNPLSLARAIRDAVREADKNQPVDQLQPLDDLIASTLAPRRFVMRLLECFAITAIFMAALGLYGVISFEVTRRTREIGIQVALGAPLPHVRNRIVLQGMSLALIGVTLGLGVAYSLTGFLGSLLYGTPPHDPLTFAVVPFIVLSVTFVSCCIPARRATCINPAEALSEQ